MERTAYTLLEKMESSWWYNGRSKNIFAAFAHAKVPIVESALDYGAGFGGMKDVFAQLAKNTDAFEPDAIARKSAAGRGYRTIFLDESSAFKEQYDLIGLFDVLEHIEDDRGFLERAHGALTPSGRLVLTIPAFMYLWSVHDVKHHHFRRYTKSALCTLLAETNYEVEYASYTNCILLLPAMLMRLTGRTGEEGLTPPPFINTLLTMLVEIEAAILRYMPLPFGLSLVVVARKK